MEDFVTRHAVKISAAVIAAILGIALMFSPPAHAQDHAWRGHVRICITDGIQTNCENFVSADTFPTRQTCEAEMVARVNRFAAALHQDHPEWSGRGVYACEELPEA